MEKVKCKLATVSHMEFQHILWRGLWDIWKISFMAFCKLELISNQYAENHDCMTIFAGIYHVILQRMIPGIHEKVHLQVLSKLRHIMNQYD
jgi:hypothetical protein